MPKKKDDDIDDYLFSWGGRLRGSLLEMTILYHAAYSNQIYAYSIKKELDLSWKSFSPPLPTIYSTIKRMEKYEFINTTSEIINSRVQRRINILEKGWQVLERMQDELQEFLKIFEFHDKEINFKRKTKDVNN